MDRVINDFKFEVEKIISHLREDMKTIRTGRVSPGILENLSIDAYAGQTKLKLMEMAVIVNEGATALIINPFDPTTIIDIEKAVLKSPLGLSPQVQGNKILIKFPAMSSEQREKFIRLVSQKIEEKRVLTRNQRDEARKKIKFAFEHKEITEDQKFRLDKEIDNITSKFMNEFDTIKKNKEIEIMAVS